MDYNKLILKTKSDITLIENTIENNNSIIDNIVTDDIFIKLNIVEYNDYLKRKKTSKEILLKTIKKML